MSCANIRGSHVKNRLKHICDWLLTIPRIDRDPCTCPCTWTSNCSRAPNGVSSVKSLKPSLSVEPGRTEWSHDARSRNDFLHNLALSASTPRPHSAPTRLETPEAYRLCWSFYLGTDVLSNQSTSTAQLCRQRPDDVTPSALNLLFCLTSRHTQVTCEQHLKSSPF